MSSNETQANGWTAVPVSGKQIIEARGERSQPAAVKVEDMPFPSDDPLVKDVESFARHHLSEEAFNHSMRVFYWGKFIAQQVLPEHGDALSPVTWACTCLLHDIGTAEAFLKTTRMSFDIYGGIKAMEVLKVSGSTDDQAEAVAEAIIRHQDMGVDGTITFTGQLIQLATLYDNVGVYEGVEDFGGLIHEETRALVNKAFPRLRWTSWFAGTVRIEENCKPWCHTTHIPDFDKKIKANTLQKPWE